MKFDRKIQKIWHDAFYALAPKGAVSFARSCKDVTADIDLRQKPHSILGHLRFGLHMSLCQACRNYRHLSNGLDKATIKLPKAGLVDVNSLNKILLNKFARKQEDDSSK